MKRNWERIIAGIIILSASFGLIYLDAIGRADIGKLGHTAIGGWIILIAQFYFRKSPETKGQ